MKGTLIQQGIDLMIYGMGTVFIFLISLVLVIGAMSRLINKFFTEANDPVAIAAGNSDQVEPLIKKIIQSAIDQHRKR
jgi:oxaloacetate decarboxylase gamma subunit